MIPVTNQNHLISPGLCDVRLGELLFLLRRDWNRMSTIKQKWDNFLCGRVWTKKKKKMFFKRWLARGKTEKKTEIKYLFHNYVLCYRSSKSIALSQRHLGAGRRESSTSLKVKVLLSCVWLFATPWIVARQAPLSMEFFRQEYWSG